MDEFEVDFSELTIYRVDENGNKEDLNSLGHPISTYGGLRHLAEDLYEAGAYNHSTRREILSAIDSRSEFLKGVK